MGDDSHKRIFDLVAMMFITIIAAPILICLVMWLVAKILGE